MAALGYDIIIDPNTGEQKLRPCLFPFSKTTGTLSSEEMEQLVESGVIPRDLYENSIKESAQMEDIRRRVMAGEQVTVTELPKAPWALTDFLLNNKGKIFGVSVLNKIFHSVDKNDPDIVWLSFVYESILSLASTDPLPIHFHAVRKILKDNYGIVEDKAVDLVTRSLLKHLKAISQFSCFKHTALTKNPINDQDVHDHIKDEKAGINRIDAEFVKYLKRIGKKGKELSNKVSDNCASLFNEYENSNYSPESRRAVWSLWTPTEGEEHTPVLSLLTQAIWEDECQRAWNFESSGAPSIVKPILERIIPILSPKKSKNHIHETDNEIVLTNSKGDYLLSAPAIDERSIALLKNGVKEFGTLTGHKLIRWQVAEGFNRCANGEQDPRLITIEGGFSKIAEMIKCSSKVDIGKIKDILHAQAYCKFHYSDGTSGNMIALRTEDFHRNGEPSKIIITLGDVLLPGHVCKFQGKDRRLIPIGELPPLHGSPNSHASQAQLQLLILSEFSNQSDRLAKEGSAYIPSEKWRELANEAGLNPDKIDQIIAHWSTPDFFNCFLDRQGDEYCLAKYYERANNFLLDQGRNRIVNSERGKKSIETQQKKKKKS